MSTLSKTLVAATRPGSTRMDRLTIGPQVANLPHNAARGGRIFGVMLTLCFAGVRPANWPTFRGPNGSAVAEGPAAYEMGRD